MLCACFAPFRAPVRRLETAGAPFDGNPKVSGHVVPP